MGNENVLLKEIDLIQACIVRMAQNSFAVKGWMISLVSVVIALLPERLELDIRVLCVVSFMITFCFWYLDGYFLKMEQLYRRKYQWVIENRPSTLDFAYDLDPHNSKMWINAIAEPCIASIMWSKSLRPFYLLVIAMELFVFINAFFRWF